MARKKVPHDEMLLAEAIAEANARGLKGCTGIPFLALATDAAVPTACCAIGAVALLDGNDEAAYADPYGVARCVLRREQFRRWNDLAVATGNDLTDEWDCGRQDRGESFGWAFRNAMEE